MSRSFHGMSGRLALFAGAAFVALATVAMPSPARAWWRGGVVIGLPVFVGPPAVVVQQPPVVYAPGPPVIYAPPQAQGQWQGQGQGQWQGQGSPPGGYSSAQAPSCYAGPYVCPMAQAAPAGSSCACNDNNGQLAYGQVH